MTLGEKIKQARLEAGLSQRQVCGTEITRNMLSLIENGTARPSMTTLQYLAGQLGKPISFFLEEDAVCSPNQQRMEAARKAFAAGQFKQVLTELEEYIGDDPLFDWERWLLKAEALLNLAEQAVREKRYDRIML
jgi:transcriptional regulator with XRE-family HTH domain